MTHPLPRPAGEGGLRFAGYAALFGVADAARDTIRPGAFARTLAERRQRGLGPLPLLWEHRPGQRIGTVELAREDARGLRVIARVERIGSRAAALLARRGVSGLSFGYRARRFRRAPAGRVLEDVELFEVSLVMRPLQHRARLHLILPTRGEVAARQG